MKKIDISSVKWLYKKSVPFIWRILILTVCAGIVSYVSVRFALVSKKLLDSAQLAEQRQFFGVNLLRLAVLVVCQLLLHIVYTLVSLKTETTLKNSVQSSLYQTLLYKKWKSVTAYHSGELLNRLNGDVNIVSSNIVSFVPTAFALVSRIILSFWALYVLDRDLALIFLIVGPFIMLVARIYSQKIKPISKKCLESQGRVHSFILETLRNLQVVKSFGVEDKMTAKTSNLQKENLSYIMKRGYLSIFANILFYISLTIGYYFAVAWCAWKIAAGIMTIGTLAAIIQLVGQVQTPFKDLAAMIPQVYNMIVSAERIIELENLPDEEMRYMGINADEIYKNMTDISINSLGFSYNKERIFENADAVIKKGSLVAISGISGIGKSTLIKLIMGIITPDAGEIKVNTSKGSYIADASLRSLFAYVPQGNMILSGSVRENIAFMNDEVTDDEIISAAKTACIWDVISSLPEGLSTILGEGGMGLSEGQIQRLAVARAICSGAPILLLDEATSALDEETEDMMLQNIIEKKDTTCIIISHKECAFKKCNIYLTIENGKIKTTYPTLD